MEYADTDSGENTKRRVQGWTTGQEEAAVGLLWRLAGCRSSFPLQSGKDWAAERSHDHQATFSQTFMEACCFQGFVGGRGFSPLPPPPCRLLRRDVHYVPLHDKCIFHIKCNTKNFVLVFTLLPRSEKEVLRLPARFFLSVLDVCNAVDSLLTHPTPQSLYLGTYSTVSTVCNLEHTNTESEWANLI